MSPVDEIINKLEKLEPELRSIDRLYSTGCIHRGATFSDAGDWQVYTWKTSFEGDFTAGAMQRVRQNGEPFPAHVHKERAWIMCSRGEVRVRVAETDRDLKVGDFVVIDPDILHEIYALSKSCCVVFVTIPADMGYEHGYERSGNGELDPGC